MTEAAAPFPVMSIAQCNALMVAFGIEESHLIDNSYSDMVEAGLFDAGR